MASNSTNHWKLGLFVVLGLSLAGGALFALGASRLQKEVLVFVTYFDESVQGLEVGSPVKFRGVTIGTVAEISVATDRRHVEVTSAVDVEKLRRLGLRSDEAGAPVPPPDEAGAPVNPPDEAFVPETLRIQLVSAGITGVKFLQADFFELKDHPLPPLGDIEPPLNYVPAVPSTLKSLEESVVHVMARVPALTEKVELLLDRANQALVDIDADNLSRDLRGSIARVDSLLATSQRRLDALDVEALNRRGLALADRLNGTLGDADRVLGRVDEALARVTAENGLLASVERSAAQLESQLAHLQLDRTVERAEESIASVDSAARAVSVGSAAVTDAAQAVEDVARDSQGLGVRLEQTLVAIEAAAEALRSVADALERDSDMLLKGRAVRDE